MTISKAVSIVGALSAAIVAALSVEGFVPIQYAGWLMLASGVLSAIGRRLVDVERLNNPALAWALVAVSALTVIAGATHLVGAKYAAGAAGVAAVLLSFCRSLLGWQETPDQS